MIIVLQKEASETELQDIVARIKHYGLEPHVIVGVARTVIGLVGDKNGLEPSFFEGLPGVEKAVPIMAPYKLTSRDAKAEDSIIQIKNVTIGDGKMVYMAGPCAIESREQILETAEQVKIAGASILRGGAFKPRTSPYSFQGLGERGLEYLQEAGETFGMPTVSEVINPSDVELVARYVDILQIGARNMQNFSLLRQVGHSRKPVLLKRGLSATIEEWLMAAEYILSEGNYQVILCERGIRTFETATRNTLDVGAIALARRLSHLPVIADPSHATGRSELVTPAGCAAVAAGAQGLMVEVHPNPDTALSDGAQSLTPRQFGQMIKAVQRVAGALTLSSTDEWWERNVV
ncbi:MAG: 3-deoxy-7-phosphoheptulonate synthase [Firmicutes bacterium]|mgnify:FL=1|jgi:3-deoxy-7-phosphoheptulonate synthase|nr:3-deoxy-7-phosphoheptulonate synthase [Bacillota bacterium]